MNWGCMNWDLEVWHNFWGRRLAQLVVDIFICFVIVIIFVGVIIALIVVCKCWHLVLCCVVSNFELFYDIKL